MLIYYCAERAYILVIQRTTLKFHRLKFRIAGPIKRDNPRNSNNLLIHIFQIQTSLESLCSAPYNRKKIIPYSQTRKKTTSGEPPSPLQKENTYRHLPTNQPACTRGRCSCSRAETKSHFAYLARLLPRCRQPLRRRNSICGRAES